MREFSLSKFISNLRIIVDISLKEKRPVKIVRRSGRDFVIIGAKEWDCENENFYILQNASLMRQIDESENTNSANTGYIPSSEEIDEITGF